MSRRRPRPPKSKRRRQADRRKTQNWQTKPMVFALECGEAIRHARGSAAPPGNWLPLTSFGLSALPGDRRGSGSATACETKSAGNEARPSLRGASPRQQFLDQWPASALAIIQTPAYTFTVRGGQAATYPNWRAAWNEAHRDEDSLINFMSDDRRFEVHENSPLEFSFRRYECPSRHAPKSPHRFDLSQSRRRFGQIARATYQISHNHSGSQMMARR
jgi:hypothetical protein